MADSHERFTGEIKLVEDVDLKAAVGVRDLVVTYAALTFEKGELVRIRRNHTTSKRRKLPQ
jgi:hypothetical protein